MGDSMPRPVAPAAARGTSPPSEATLQEWTVHHLDVQAQVCDALGSALYARLLEEAAGDVRGGGPTWAVLEPHATRDTGAALALRFMAAVHRLVLRGTAAQLAAHYPSVGGDANRPGAWPAFRQTLIDHTETLRGLVGRSCQTNEVGRCAALAPGMLVVAAQSGLPLRLLEIGTSAGLNLRWDHYRYEHTGDDRAWGEPASPVCLRGHWEVPVELLDTTVTVAQREGCDPHPVDPLTEEGRLSLSASVWADQPHRFERLAGALQLAAEVPVGVAHEPARTWVPRHLATTDRGLATIVYHSVVMQYLPPGERAEVVRAIAAAGASATSAAPLYWLRMEPEQPLRAMAVRLTVWPGGEEHLLASAGAHGDPVRWRT